MNKASKKKINWFRFIVIVLVIIGSICVIDNTFRLGKELCNAVTHTIGHHQWSTVVIH
jgi:hypothetical protein